MKKKSYGVDRLLRLLIGAYGALSKIILFFKLSITLKGGWLVTFVGLNDVCLEIIEGKTKMIGKCLYYMFSI